MATTYSNSLKLTLIGDGDQSGIWGQTTNNNLGTLLEQAITGVTSIVMSDANYTLTNYNGVVDEARNAVLVVSGANNAVRDLIPPLVEKLYTVVNNTSGGYAIRVIGASGTGVNIPNGTACLVYCNGTNFYSGLSGTPGNFDVNGNISASGNLSITGTTTLTGAATAPTPSYPDNTTKIATTAYVTSAITGYGVPVPSGSVFLLYQASAPTGWTQVTTAGLDDIGLRITTSTGGSTGGTTAFSTVFTNQTPTITTSGFSAGATTLSTSQIPAHTHSIGSYAGQARNNNTSGTTFSGENQAGDANYDTFASDILSGQFIQNAGGGGSHTHTVSGSATSSAITLNVKYANIILCSKN